MIRTQVPIKLQKVVALVGLGILFLSVPTFAQHANGITPLHQFFQENYDTTIIHHSWSSRYSAPNYLIVAKQKDGLYLFTYTSPYKGLPGRYFPGNLSQRFLEEEGRFTRTAPDTNRYLLPKDIAQATLGKNWDELQALNLWNLKVDKYNLKSAGECMSEDGTTDTFHLISKEGVKTLDSYEPDYWEACLGKDIDRQKAIQTRAVFQRIAKEE